jgi:hypothetical protein
MHLLYSTYLGGSFEDYGESLALDSQDNIYIVGATQSDDFPTLAAFQTNRAGINQDTDVFVSKISAAGSLVYSTYLGGMNLENVRRVAVDNAGNAFVAGSTRSTNFPTTPGAFQPAYAGGVAACGTSGFGGPLNCYDMFATKIAPNGGLVYSTYIGGGLDDYATGIALNEVGEAFIVGYTSSDDFPGKTPNGQLGADISLVKLNADGSNLAYTVIIDSAVANGSNGVALDQSGNAYLAAAQNAPSDLYVAKILDSGSPPPPPPPATPTPTNTPLPPTPTPTVVVSTSTHVGDLDGGSAWVYRRSLWQASVTVLVHDANHNPLTSVTVHGAWSNGYSGMAQCTTGADGSCVLSTGAIGKRSARAIFTVTGLTRNGFTYSAGDNHDPDGDSNGTRITVARP